MLKKIVTPIITYPKTALSILAVIFVLLGYLALQLQILPSLTALIPADGEYRNNERILETAFQRNSGATLLFSLDETSRLRDRPGTLFDTTLAEDAQELRERLLSESQYVQSVSPLEFTDDGRYARMGIALFEPNTVDGIRKSREEVEYFVSQARLPSGVTATITGINILLERITTLLITDNLKTVLITVVLVFSVLLWYFRDIRLAILGVSSPALSLIGLAAIMVLLDIYVTITLAAVGVIVIGLGADYSIHLISAFVRNLQELKNTKKAILAAFEELNTALIAAFLTTLAGFSALILGVSPSSQAQGIVLSLAIAVIFFSTIFVLPPLLALVIKKPLKRKQQSFSFLDGWFTKLSKIQSKHPFSVIAFVLLVTVVMFFGLMQVAFSTSNSNWIPDDDEISKSFTEEEWEFGDTDSLFLLIEATRGDLRSPQTVRDVQEITEKLRGIPELVSVTSPFDELPIDHAEIHEAITNTERKDQFNRDFTITTVVAVSEGFETDEAGKTRVLEEVRPILATTPVHNARITLFGDIIRFDELGDSLQQDAGITTLVGLVLVFIVSSIMYVSLAIGFVALIPIIIAVLWALGMMGYFGVPFTQLSTGIVSLVLGIGVDFSLHLVTSVKNELARGAKTMQKAIQQALQTTGGAIFLSSVTTFFGFMALSFATLLGTQRLGWSLSLAIFSVFFVTILFVPAVLSIRKKLLKSST